MRALGGAYITLSKEEYVVAMFRSDVRRCFCAVLLTGYDIIYDSIGVKSSPCARSRVSVNHEDAAAELEAPQMDAWLCLLAPCFPDESVCSNLFPSISTHARTNAHMYLSTPI